MTSASFARLRRRDDAEPRALRLRLRLRAGGEADADVDAGVAEVQRVGVALRAVADDRDLPLLERGRGSRPCRSRWWPCRVVRPSLEVGGGERLEAALERDAPGAAELLDAEGARAAPPARRACRRCRSPRRRARPARRPRWSPRTSRRAPAARRGSAPGVRIFTSMSSRSMRSCGESSRTSTTGTSFCTWRTTCSTGFDAEPDDDRHARVLGPLGRADGEARDVVAAPREQAGDAVEHARLVLDEEADGVGGAVRLLFGRSTLVTSAVDHVVQGRAGRHHRVHLLLPRCTRTSTMVGPLCSRAPGR